MHHRFTGTFKGGIYKNGKCIGQRAHYHRPRKFVFLDEAAEIDKRIFSTLLDKKRIIEETLKVKTMEFRLPTKRVPTTIYENCGPKEKALLKAFGDAFSVPTGSLMEMAKKFPHGHIKIICTAEQFARFIVLRDKYGAENWIAELQPEFTEDKGLKIGGLWNVVPGEAPNKHGSFEKTEADHLEQVKAYGDSDYWRNLHCYEPPSGWHSKVTADAFKEGGPIYNADYGSANWWRNLDEHIEASKRFWQGMDFATGRPPYPYGANEKTRELWHKLESQAWHTKHADAMLGKEYYTLTDWAEATGRAKYGPMNWYVNGEKKHAYVPWPKSPEPTHGEFGGSGQHGSVAFHRVRDAVLEEVAADFDRRTDKAMDKAAAADKDQKTRSQYVTFAGLHRRTAEIVRSARGGKTFAETWRNYRINFFRARGSEFMIEYGGTLRKAEFGVGDFVNVSCETHTIIVSAHNTNLNWDTAKAL